MNISHQKICSFLFICYNSTGFDWVRSCRMPQIFELFRRNTTLFPLDNFLKHVILWYLMHCNKLLNYPRQTRALILNDEDVWNIFILYRRVTLIRLVAVDPHCWQGRPVNLQAINASWQSYHRYFIQVHTFIKYPLATTGNRICPES